MPNIIEEAAAKTAGKIGAIKAKITGLDGVFRRLSEEHKEVGTLIGRAAISADAEKRADLWGKIRQELTAHEHAELQIVYPALQAEPELEDVVRQHQLEADELEALIRDVDRAPLGSVQWEGCIKQLQGAVLQHAEREEEHFFPRAQSAIGERRAEELEQRYLDAKQALLHGL